MNIKNANIETLWRKNRIQSYYKFIHSSRKIFNSIDGSFRGEIDPEIRGFKSLR